MATVTYDGQSFMIDGRRIWLLGGQVDYGRIPRASWADRLHAAKLAGLNTVAASVPWALHEPRPGQFSFSGEHDIRHFVKLVHQAGLWCVLRVGPYIDDGWDMGGLPQWLARKPDVRLRAPNAPLLEACSRYLTALAEQVADLQITSPGESGPIILLQNEYAWTCGDPDAAAGYLGELARFAHEAGFNVPTINANNLWQSTEGEIDGWVGRDDMLATLRQLAAVNPDQPRVIVDLATDRPQPLGLPETEPLSPVALQRRLAEVLAGGGQFILSPFAGGVTPGFMAGRRGARTDDFLPSLHGGAAPVDEAGVPGPAFPLVRRLAVFASHFARVLANLDQGYRPVVLDQRVSAGTADSTSIVDLRGSQGSLTFVFAEEPTAGKTPRPRDVDLMLADGTSLTVPLGRQAVSWALFDVLLGSRARLDFCSLCMLLAVGRVLVCFGPGGARGSISINGSALVVEVPKGKQPTVVELEEHTVIVASEEQADEIFASADKVYVGVAGLDGAGLPVPLPGARQCVVFDAEGVKSKIAFADAPPARAATGSIALTSWQQVPDTEHVLGESPRYAGIEGPAPLSMLGAPFGYGWYKISLKAAAAKKPKVLAPASRDRLHLFLNGELLAVAGLGPGAEAEPLVLPLTKGEHQLVVLAENLGRPASGQWLAEAKGLVDHLYEVKPFRVGRHKIEPGDRLELLKFQSPLWNVRPGDRIHPDRLTWRFAHRRKSPIILTLNPVASRLLVLLNDGPLRLLDAPGPTRLVFSSEDLNRGNNVLQLAVMGDEPDPAAELARLGAAAVFLEGVEELTAKGHWSYAKWEPPPPSSYEPMAKTRAGAFKGPTWYRAGFELRAEGAPIRLDLAGLSKGQVFLNGVHLGRYFLTTRTGAAVSRETAMLLPAAILSHDGENDLVIFDEHGHSPAKTRLLVERGSRPIRA